MTMQDRQVKSALNTLLVNSAAGQYQVVGYEPQPQGAKQFTGTNRTVRAFLSDGELPLSGGSLGTPAKHNVSMLLEMVVTASSEIDVGTLEDPASTDAQRAAALVGTVPAALIADEAFDEFKDILWNILMKPANQWLGFTKYKVTSRWVPNWKKDKIIPMTNYVIVTGYLKLDFTVDEQATGETPTAGTHNITDFTPIDGDTTQKSVQQVGEE